MSDNQTSLIFFGSGPVAASSLEKIIDYFQIEMVITKSRPVHHRGSAPVEILAKDNNIALGFANSREEVDSILTKTSFESPIGLIIDFGVIVSEFAIGRFKKGIINSHFSLLPKWRGADPITYCLLAGDNETGVSLMKIVPKLDEGPLLAREKIQVEPDVNSIRLTQSLISLSDTMLKKYLPEYVAGTLTASPQSGSDVSYSHKVKKAEGIIDWKKPAVQIEREIRAYAGWPKSRTKLNRFDCIITKAEITEGKGSPGSYRQVDKSLLIFTGTEALSIKRLQPAGKIEMSIEEFLRGYAARL